MEEDDNTGLQRTNGNGNSAGDPWPASYHLNKNPGTKRHRAVADPCENITDFLETELSLGALDDMQRHLWFAGSRRPAVQLHFQVAMGREIVVAERMDLHLLCGSEGRIFMKPIPRFLLHDNNWESFLKCDSSCRCERDESSASTIGSSKQGRNVDQRCMQHLRQIANGFLYSYACLISSEADFFIANEKRLLPRAANDAKIKWQDWKRLARELLRNHDPKKVNPRFLRGELRLSRINAIHVVQRRSPFNPYLRRWHNYSSVFRDNLSWIAAGAVFVALVLTAMQVGFSTQLKDDPRFSTASYGFTIFALLGPLCSFGLVIIFAFLNLVWDAPGLFKDLMTKPPTQVRTWA
ncbi:hypothetical protein QQS21_007467 [Conoideocrella luteorostrata]|uniref:Uncharacterized protein n=1 Tax=Conoideocrella luteorostrata TaxID=1105319 RepID=A0AAJ0FX04_9HYPO|nr:hypothetical protein QQS21_007467 [Conoideocrella luteorostrata]